MSNYKYKIGEYVVYGSNGICKITDIKKMTLSPIIGERNYYILEQINTKMSTIYVATDNEPLCAKMRYVLNEKEILDILHGAKENSIKWMDDRKARTQYFYNILHGTSHEDLLLMISCIYLKGRELAENGKRLSDSDAGILRSAEKIIREEFAFALSIASEEVGVFIRKELEIETEDIAI